MNTCKPRLAAILCGVWICALLCGTSLAGATELQAEVLKVSDSGMPLMIEERLWNDPGPEQSEPGAPRLLIVHPRREVTWAWGEAFRYAGRVEPEDATVTLNGDVLKVWPGGTFTGLAPLGDETEIMWRFEANAGGKTTTVERSLRQSGEVEPAAAWPLEFWTRSHEPQGEYWLREGSTLPVRLHASPGHRAEVRLGEGPWQPMEQTATNETQGGVYEAELAIGEGLTTPALAPVTFRLTATDPEPDTLELTSSQLKVATLAPAAYYLGRVFEHPAGFLKDQESWDRYGVLAPGTPLTIIEVHDERVLVGFSHAKQGWIETAKVHLDFTPVAPEARVLDAPQVVLVSDDMLSLRWPDQPAPVAAVFEHQATEKTHALRVQLPGADDAAHLEQQLPADGPFEGLKMLKSPNPGLPIIDLNLKRPLWGYAMDWTPDRGLEIRMRAWPVLQDATPNQPLKGLRIMIDAGHGGRDLGALSPSGLAEADLNLVQAAWLERFLEARGAEVAQIRRDDRYVGLDDRVLMAQAWLPDLFVSLHHNSVGMTTEPMRSSGPRMYYHYNHSQPLAAAIATQLGESLEQEGPAPLYVRNFRVNCNLVICPSVLVETAFMSHPEDDALLRQSTTSRVTAEAIARGIEALFTSD